MIRIYADNAATTKMSKTAIDAMVACMSDEYGNPSSLHTVGQTAEETLENARTQMAAVLNCKPNEIYFTSGGSEADNQAIRSAAATGARRGKKHIISTKIEHHAVLHTLKKLEREGFEITLLDVYEDGIVKVEDVAAALREDTALVTVMYANNEIGTIQPIAEIGALCRAKKVVFHTDAVQAIAHIAVDVVADCVDMLSLSAHKFHGPKGVGVLYARRGIPLINLIDGGSQERGKRAGTENLPGIVSMMAALTESIAHLEENNRYVSALRDKLIAGILSSVPNSKLNGHATNRLARNANICFEGIEGESLLLLLDAKGICASSGSACASDSLDPSHVLLAVGLPHEVAHGSLRLSLDEWNTEEEIDTIIRYVPEIVAYLRSISPVWHDLQEGKRTYVI